MMQSSCKLDLTSWFKTGLQLFCVAGKEQCVWGVLVDLASRKRKNLHYYFITSQTAPVIKQPFLVFIWKDLFLCFVAQLYGILNYDRGKHVIELGFK